jgi:hypothetical protein
MAIVAATSAPALAPAIGATELRLDWAHVPGDLIELEAGGACHSLCATESALLDRARTPA